MRIYDKNVLTKLNTDESGYLIAKSVKLARTGAMEYLGEEIDKTKGKVYDVVADEAELFNDETIRSFEGKPITNDHPAEMEVNSSNWKELSVGHISNIKQDGEFLTGDIVINDSQTIKDIQSGKIQLSLGYDADLVENDGIIKKVNIKGNHLALVQEGRCGDKCKIGDGKPSIMKKILSKVFGDKKAKTKMKLGDAKKRLADAQGEYKQKLIDLEEVVSSDATPEEKAEAVETLSAEVQTASEEITAVIEEIASLASDIQEEVPAETTANDEMTAEEESKIADLETENQELKDKVAELEAQLEAEKEKEAQSTTANDVKRVFGDSVAIKASMSSADMKRAVVASTGAYTKETVKTLTDCALNSAYSAALTVSAKTSNVGKKLLGDSKPVERKLPKALGGK